MFVTGKVTVLSKRSLVKNHKTLLVTGQRCVEQFSRKEPARIGEHDERHAELTALRLVDRQTVSKLEPCRIMVASVPAGEVREVGRCSRAETSSVSWQTGTSFLYYVDHGEETLDIVFRLDLDSGTRLQLPKKPSNPLLALSHLECSPDGKSLLIVGGISAGVDLRHVWTALRWQGYF
jgi:hypothetical protein